MIILVIKYGKKPKLAFLDGIREAAQLVAPSIGPYGSNYIGQNINLTNSGYRIIKELAVDNPLSQLGVGLLVDATFNIYTQFYDGTATFIIIASRMLEMVQRALNNGVDILELNNAITEIRPQLIELLNREAEALNDGMTFSLASIAAKDEAIGRLVSKAFTEYGLGNYRIEISDELSYFYDHRLTLNTGVLSMQMLGNADTRVLDNPRVLIVCGRHDLSQLLECNPDLIIFNNLDDNEINTINRYIINCPNAFIAINVANEDIKSIRAISDFRFTNGNLVAEVRQAIISDTQTILEANNNYGNLVFTIPSNYNTGLVSERLEAAIATIINTPSGVSLGQGIAYLHLLDNLETLTDNRVLIAILEEALKQPYCQILENGFITNIEFGRPYDFGTHRFVSEDEFMIYQPTKQIIATIDQALHLLSDYLFIRGFII